MDRSRTGVRRSGHTGQRTHPALRGRSGQRALPQKTGRISPAAFPHQRGVTYGQLPLSSQSSVNYQRDFNELPDPLRLLHKKKSIPTGPTDKAIAESPPDNHL